MLGHVSPLNETLHSTNRRTACLQHAPNTAHSVPQTGNSSGRHAGKNVVIRTNDNETTQYLRTDGVPPWYRKNALQFLEIYIYICNFITSKVILFCKYCVLEYYSNKCLFHLPVAQVVVWVFQFGWLVSFISPSVFRILDCRGFCKWAEAPVHQDGLVRSECTAVLWKGWRKQQWMLNPFCISQCFLVMLNPRLRYLIFYLSGNKKKGKFSRNGWSIPGHLAMCPLRFSPKLLAVVIDDLETNHDCLCLD